METPVTVVTGLYDIDREKLGDGRKMSDYIEWLRRTMLLNVSMVVYCEEGVYEQIKDVRENVHANTRFIMVTKETIEYFQYEDRVDQIVRSGDYLHKIHGSGRLEVVLPMYNLLIMNKIVWLHDVASKNYFNSTFFMWVDAGCSRFFEDYTADRSLSWPDVSKLDEHKFNIQVSPPLFYEYDPESLMFRSEHFTTATIFSGTVGTIEKIKCEVKRVFEYMLEHNCVNNEQIVFAMIYKSYPELFNCYVNTTQKHLPYFRYLCGD